MTKPFHKDELVARIHAIVRRSKGHAQSVIQTGDLVVNLDAKIVEVNGARVHLTGKESGSGATAAKGRDPTKEMSAQPPLSQARRAATKDLTSSPVSASCARTGHTSSSSRFYIETVWGRGYVLRQPADDEAVELFA